MDRGDRRRRYEILIGPVKIGWVVGRCAPGARSTSARRRAHRPFEDNKKVRASTHLPKRDFTDHCPGLSLPIKARKGHMSMRFGVVRMDWFQTPAGSRLTGAPISDAASGRSTTLSAVVRMVRAASGVSTKP